MSSKIRIKIGSMEVEFEGSEEFLKKDLIDFVSSLSELHKKINLSADDILQSSKELVKKSEEHIDIEVTTGTIARKIGCKTQPDLALAAAGQLTLVQKKVSFSRNDLLAEMKTATHFYDESHRKNLSNILKSLGIREKLIERKKGVYALTDIARLELEAALAK